MLRARPLATAPFPELPTVKRYPDVRQADAEVRAPRQEWFKLQASDDVEQGTNSLCAI